MDNDIELTDIFALRFDETQALVASCLSKLTFLSGVLTSIRAARLGFRVHFWTMSWAWWGLVHDWCNRSASSWVEFFRSSVVSQTNLKFSNKASVSERSFRFHWVLFVPATNRSRRATSKCSWKLHLDACRCMRTTNSRIVLLGFRTRVWNFARSTSSNWAGLTCCRSAYWISATEASFKVLWWTKVLGKVNSSSPTAVRKAPLIAISSLVPLVSIQKLIGRCVRLFRQWNNQCRGSLISGPYFWCAWRKL